jgi:hypothetical protein
VDYTIRIEVKDNRDRNRFWNAQKRLEEGTGTEREQRTAPPRRLGAPARSL